jgi:hypothetical protein
MKIILLNGPPRSGKDTAALAIEEALDKWGFLAIHEKFSWPNKAAFAAIWQRKMDCDFNVYYYEERKGEIVPEIGVSFRQFQIDFSEKFMKPLYGKDVFAQLLLQRIEGYKADNTVCVVSDCGFQVEVDTVWNSKKFQGRDMLLLRCTRPGASFEGDSREMVDTEWFTSRTLSNSGSLDQWRNYAIHTVAKWLDFPGSEVIK